MARQLADEYKLHHLQIKDVIAETIGELVSETVWQIQ